MIDFKTSSYFSGVLVFVGYAMAICAVLISPVNLIAFGILMVIAGLLITTHYRLSLDPERKTYHDYVWIFGIKSGERGTFDRVQYLFIKESKVSQTMSMRVASTTIRKEVYDGYIKFSDGNTIHLLTSDSKTTVRKRLERIASKLNVRIMDYTSELTVN